MHRTTLYSHHHAAHPVLNTQLAHASLLPPHTRTHTYLARALPKSTCHQAQGVKAEVRGGGGGGGCRGLLASCLHTGHRRRVLSHWSMQHMWNLGGRGGGAQGVKGSEEAGGLEGTQPLTG